MNIQVTAHQALLLTELIRPEMQGRRELLSDERFTQDFPNLTARTRKELNEFENLFDQLTADLEPDPAVS